MLYGFCFECCATVAVISERSETRLIVDAVPETDMLNGLSG